MSTGDDGPIDAVASSVIAGLERLFPPVRPADLFSKPIERDGALIVTASTVERAGGFGFGAGEGGAKAPDGGGGGGGGALNARPVAVIRIADDGVSVVSILDFTRITIAALAVLIALRKTWSRG